MAITVRKLSDDIVFGIAAQWNTRSRDLATALSKPHADITSVSTTAAGDYKAPTSTPDIIASANASSLGTSVTLVNEIKAVLNRHYADDLAHKATNTAISTADATDLATGITLANAIKSSYETHRASTGKHYTADSTNTISSSDASDQSSLNTLLNELKTDLNAHIQTAPLSQSINLVGP